MQRNKRNTNLQQYNKDLPARHISLLLLILKTSQATCLNVEKLRLWWEKRQQFAEEWNAKKWNGASENLYLKYMECNVF